MNVIIAKSELYYNFFIELYNNEDFQRFNMHFSHIFCCFIIDSAFHKKNPRFIKRGFFISIHGNTHLKDYTKLHNKTTWFLFCAGTILSARRTQRR